MAKNQSPKIRIITLSEKSRKASNHRCECQCVNFNCGCECVKHTPCTECLVMPQESAMKKRGEPRTIFKIAGDKNKK